MAASRGDGGAASPSRRRPRRPPPRAKNPVALAPAASGRTQRANARRTGKSLRARSAQFSQGRSPTSRRATVPADQVETRETRNASAIGRRKFTQPTHAGSNPRASSIASAPSIVMAHHPTGGWPTIQALGFLGLECCSDPASRAIAAHGARVRGDTPKLVLYDSGPRAVRGARADVGADGGVSARARRAL